MNFLRSSVLRINSIFTKNVFNTYAVANRTYYSALRPSIDSQSSLLKVTSPLIEQVCGFKVKLKLRKRCKDCYIVVRDGRSYIICPTHPRHKQMSMVKKPKYTWIITHASQSKIRPW